MDKNIEAKVIAAVFLPLVETHGLERATKIVHALTPLMEAWNAIPPDLAEDCEKLVADVITNAKQLIK